MPIIAPPSWKSCGLNIDAELLRGRWRIAEPLQTSTLFCAKIAEKFHANVSLIGHVTKSSVSSR